MGMGERDPITLTWTCTHGHNIGRDKVGGAITLTYVNMNLDTYAGDVTINMMFTSVAIQIGQQGHTHTCINTHTHDVYGYIMPHYIITSCHATTSYIQTCQSPGVILHFLMSHYIVFRHMIFHRLEMWVIRHVLLGYMMLHYIIMSCNSLLHTHDLPLTLRHLMLPDVSSHYVPLQARDVSHSTQSAAP